MHDKERKRFDRGQSGERGQSSRGPRDPRLEGLRPLDPQLAPLGPLARQRRRRGDVRLALLLLLKIDGPRNGYQLMQALAQRSEGRWRPSPGSVYPALTQLEEEGLIHSRATQSEASRTFELTDAGHELINQREEQSAPWEPEGAADDARAALHRAALATMRTARQAAQDGDAEQIAQVTELFTEMRRAIYRVLAGDERPS